jgi:acetolactate synthase small subunit
MQTLTEVTTQTQAQATTPAAAQTTETLIILMENEAGVLSNLIGLFSQRTVNIDSLTVLPTEYDKTLSTVTLTTSTGHKVMASLAQRIERLVDVIEVDLLSENVDVGESAKAAA